MTAKKFKQSRSTVASADARQISRLKALRLRELDEEYTKQSHRLRRIVDRARRKLLALKDNNAHAGKRH